MAEAVTTGERAGKASSAYGCERTRLMDEHMENDP